MIPSMELNLYPNFAPLIEPNILCPDPVREIVRPPEEITAPCALSECPAFALSSYHFLT